MQEVVTLVKGRKHWMICPCISMALFLNKYGKTENENQKSETIDLLEKKLAMCTYKKFGLQKLQTFFSTSCVIRGRGRGKECNYLICSKFHTSISSGSWSCRKSFSGTEFGSWFYGRTLKQNSTVRTEGTKVQILGAIMPEWAWNMNTGKPHLSTPAELHIIITTLHYIASLMHWPSSQCNAMLG